MLRSVRREAHRVIWNAKAILAKFNQQPGTESCAVGGLSNLNGIDWRDKREQAP